MASRRHDCERGAHAVRQPRSGLRRLGLSRVACLDRSTRFAPGASGDISLEPPQTSNDYVVWYQPRLGTYNTSSLVYDDTYYTLLDRGFLLAHDALTGREIYGRRRVAPGTGFTASPWAYNDQVFLLGEDGDTYVVKAGPDFEILRTNSLNEMSLATPGGGRRQPPHPDPVEAVSNRRGNPFGRLKNITPQMKKAARSEAKARTARLARPGAGAKGSPQGPSGGLGGVAPI